MNACRRGVRLLALVLLFSLRTASARAQDPGGSPAAPVQASAVAELSAQMATSIPIQGRLTDAGGAPLDGDYSITRALYGAVSGGTALCSNTTSVAVTKGLFATVLTGCVDDVFYGRQLYLGIKVGADAEMTPRQPIYAVPYARSVRPGAIVYQTEATGRGLIVTSIGSGSGGTALWAQNTNTTPGGVGVWALAQGSDAAIIASNNGTGPLLKGFGSDGGEDDFRINNDGSIETRADSTLVVPGSAFVRLSSGDTTRWFIQPGGAVHLWRGATAGGKTVHYPVTTPTQLYGQSVTVESITVYYQVQDGAKGYISNTYLTKLVDADSSEYLIQDETHRTSTTATSYTLIPAGNTTLGPAEGLTVAFHLEFADDANHVRIGAIEIRLGHHGLY